MPTSFKKQCKVHARENDAENGKGIANGESTIKTKTIYPNRSRKRHPPQSAGTVSQSTPAAAGNQSQITKHRAFARPRAGMCALVGRPGANL